MYSEKKSPYAGLSIQCGPYCTPNGTSPEKNIHSNLAHKRMSCGLLNICIPQPYQAKRPLPATKRLSNSVDEVVKKP